MRRILAIALVLTATAGIVSAQGRRILSSRSPRPHLVEHGFMVEEVRECGTLGASQPGRRPHELRSVLLAEDIECSPGGPWGSFVYLALDSALDEQVHIERVAFGGEAQAFVFVGFNAFTNYLTFSPLGWRSGDRILIYKIPMQVDPVVTPHGHQGYDPNGAPAGGGTGALGLPLLGPVGIDPSGAFDYDLFWTRGLDLFRRDAGDTTTLFSTLSSTGPEIRFGPGGIWGTDLYVAGQVVSPDGTVSSFPWPFREFDWVFGTGFNGDMFDLVRGDPASGEPNAVYRVKPDGSRTLFATSLPRQMVSCDGALWFAGAGGCWVIRHGGGDRPASREAPAVSPDRGPRACPVAIGRSG